MVLNVPLLPLSHEPIRGFEQKFHCACCQCAPRLPTVYKYAKQYHNDMMNSSNFCGVFFIPCLRRFELHNVVMNFI